MTGPELDDPAIAGRVGRPHGLDGSFHVRDARVELLREGRALMVGETAARICRRAGSDARPIVRLEGFGDRAAAQALRGRLLRAATPEGAALRPGEWRAEQLEGCVVGDGDREVGVVRRLVALPSCEALEVQRVDGGELLVPLVADAVRDVDADRRRVEIDLDFLEPGAG